MDAMIKRGDIYYADLSPVVGSEQGGSILNAEQSEAREGSFLRSKIYLSYSFSPSHPTSSGALPEGEPDISQISFSLYQCSTAAIASPYGRGGSQRLTERGERQKLPFVRHYANKFPILYLHFCQMVL